MLTVLAAVALAGQTRTLDLPKVVYELPVTGGQREIILGAKPYEPTLLAGYFEREIGPKHLTTPDNTGSGYVDSWTPGGTAEDRLGTFDTSTRADTLFDKPCVLITTSARWNQKMGRRPNEIKWENLAKQQWWISPEGKIMRHYSMLQTPEGSQIGDCTYGKDSIERRYTDVRGQTTFGEIFPACGMDALHAQFKPMMEDGKVVARDKEFFVANPLTGALDKYSVHASGTFKGVILYATFSGKTFDIEGPNKFFQRVYVDDKGDLVRVSLTDEKYFVITQLPKSHMDEYGRPIRKGG